MADWTVVRHKRGGIAGRKTPAVNGVHQSVVPSSNRKSSTAAAGHVRFYSHVPPPKSHNLPSSVNEDAPELNQEERLLGKMQRAREKVEQSVFFSGFMRQMQHLEVIKNLSRSGTGKVGSGDEEEEDEEEEEEEEDPHERFNEEGKEQSLRRPKVELVVYGVGSITDSEISRCQLSLALLMKKKFAERICDVVVYDPVMSPLDRSVMVQLGFSPLENNDGGRRPLNGPTLFFMPHCDFELYEEVLQENLKPNTVDQMVILGNSFRTYHYRSSVSQLQHAECPFLLKVQPTVEEVSVADNFHPTAFNDTSWHFFSKVEF
ncbi:unnamed protein product [Calypogeia fissa]